MNPFKIPSVFDKFAQYLKDKGAKEKTIVNKLQIIKAVYHANNSDILLISDYNRLHEAIIQTENIRAWGRNTTYKAFVYFKEFFFWASVREKIVGHNPIENRFDYKRSPKKESYVLRQEDSRKLWMNPFMSCRDVAIFIILEATGIRKGELCALNVGDVDFRQGQRFVHVKNGKRDGFRWIPISKLHATYLKIYINFLKSQNMADDNSPLFPKENGVRISGNRVHRIIRERGVKKNIRAYPHAMRHGYITELVEIGHDITTAQRLAGHANIRQTAEYTHLSPAFLRSKIDKISKNPVDKS